MERIEAQTGAGWSSWALPLVVGFALAVVVVAALSWPLLPHLSTHYVVSAFNGGHVWAFDYMARIFTGELPPTRLIDDLGYPEPRTATVVAWAPALLATPFRPLLGPVGAYNLLCLLSPALSFLGAWALIRRVSEASPWVATAAALTYALCPYALGSLVNGQVEKLQLWAPALILLCLHGVLTGPRRGRWLLALSGATFTGAFSCPDTLAYLPFALVAVVLHQLWLQRGARIKVLLWGTLAAIVFSATMAPAIAYFAPGDAMDERPAFVPARPLGGERFPDPSPVAQPVPTFLGTGPALSRLRTDRPPVVHFTYLGLPLVVMGLLLSCRRYPGRGLALSLLTIGLVLAAGPLVASGDAYVLRDGRRLILPAWLLDQIGYPTSTSGMYYRAIHLASLGLAMAVAGGIGRLKPGRGAVLAWSLLALVAWDTWRVTAPLWPMKVREVAALDVLEAMAEDPAPGAVLELPLAIQDYDSQEGVLATTLHHRRSTSLSQDRDPQDDKPVAELVRRVNAGLRAEDPRAALLAQGYRYVIHRPHLRNRGAPLANLEQALGMPTWGGQVPVWRLYGGDEEPGPEAPPFADAQSPEGSGGESGAR